VNRHFVDLLPVWPAGVEYQQLIYRQTDLPEEYPTRQDLVRRLHWFDRESGGCIWDPESQPSTLASSLLPSSLPEPSSSSPPSSLPEPSSLATTSSQPSTLPAVPSQSQSASRYNVKSHRETTLQEMQRQVYSESRKVQVLETAGQRERERLAGLEEEICQLRETNRRLTIAGAEAGLNVLQRDATIDRLDRAHQVQRNSWGTMREAQEREIRELQELRSRSFGRPTGREYVWVRGQPKRRRGRAVFPARVNCRPLWKENKRKVLKLLEIAEAGEIRIGDLDHAAKVDANKIKELEAELAAANETNQQLQQTHQQTVDDLQNRMDRMNDDLRGRARAIGSRHVAILDLREAMQVKNATIANLTRSIDEKEATIVARDSTIATKETAIVNLTQSRDEKEATITTHESTIANLTQSVNEKDLTIIARDSTINALQVSANQSSEAAKTRIVEVETLLATAEQSLVTANAEIDELASAAAAANGVIGAASTRINELEGSLGTAHSRVSVLEGSLAEANARVTTLEGSLGAANMRVTGFEESLATAKTENQNLSSSLSFVTTRYMERVSQMRASVTALQGSLAAANTEHQNLSSSLATAETENQNLASSLSFVTTRYMARVLQVRGLMYEVQGLMNDLATKNQQIVLLQESSRLTNQGAFQVRRQLANANVRNVALVSQVHRLLNQLQSGMARSDDQDEDLYVAALRVSLCG
jgi:chromosome segregation ATPase